jgi:hypothetical protein
MIDKKVINAVLRKYTAAEVVDQKANKPVQRWRYYFYDAPPENSIKFSYLSEILKKDTPDRDALIEKLQGGNTGKFFADYFRWKKVIIATNQYSQDGVSLVIYEADLTPFGTKVAGSERVYPESSPVSAENIETDLLLYTDKHGNSKVINIDTSGESLFSDQDPPSNLVKILMNRTKPAGRFTNYNDFSRIFDEYRIWAINLNQLLLPNMDVPKNDDVPGGHYNGGQEAFNKLTSTLLSKMQDKEQEAQPSLKQKMEQQPTPQKTPFEPVDEQTQEGVKGDYLDNPKDTSMSKKYSSQDFKFRKMIRNIIAGYIMKNNKEKEAEVGMTTGTMGGTNKGTSTISKGLYEDAKKHEIAKKKLEQAAKSIEQVGF